VDSKGGFSPVALGALRALRALLLHPLYTPVYTPPCTPPCTPMYTPVYTPVHTPVHPRIPCYTLRVYRARSAKQGRFQGVLEKVVGPVPGPLDELPASVYAPVGRSEGAWRPPPHT